MNTIQSRIPKINVTPFTLVLLLLLTATVTEVSATTYYVNTNKANANNANPGSQSAPWKTIAKASAAMQPGDVTIVNAGNYNERIVSAKNGTANAPITYQASGTVTISGGNINHNHIGIIGFTIANDEGIVISNGNHCVITNNNFTPGFIQILYQNSDDAPTGCVIRSNRFHSIKNPTGDYVVIELFGSNHLVEYNEIGPASDVDAFRLWGHNNIIRGNYVHDTTYSPNSTAHMDGFQIFGDNGWASYNQVIENNRFINSDGQLFMTSNDGVAGIHDILLRNNVFARYKQNANIGIRNMVFLNNTFYDTGIFSGSENSAGTAVGTVFKNNIFIKINGYNLTDYDANIFLHSAPWTFQNNFISTITGAPLSNFDNQPGGINGGKINFTNASGYDFSISTGSVVIDKGQTLAGFNYDLLGKGRPHGPAWDIGAYEYGATMQVFAPPPGTITNSARSLAILPPSNLRLKK